jgi:2-polyprenyl-6-methoxyphenol hydroxylase-like FAD-dependent oxidoreductase
VTLVTKMSDVIVIGGGAAGLGTALALARDGRAVTVLERDETNLPDSPDAAFRSWARRGAPQLRHSHAFLARLRLLLAARAPDVLAALLEHGASEMRFVDNLPPTMTGFTPQPGDEDLVALACRRVTFDWVLRRAILAEPAVTLVGGTRVEGLLTMPGDKHGQPHVEGVRTAEGDYRGQLVVDAGGRASSLPAWLEAIGAERPWQEQSDISILYLSRFYRLNEAKGPPPVDGVVGGDLGYMKYGVFPGDSGTFSITLAIPTDDPELRGLLRPAAFDALASVLPTTAGWIAGGRAAALDHDGGDVAVMAKLRNRLRRVVVDGTPVATGIVSVGDAAVVTNPLYGRGTSLGLVHAYALADLLSAGANDGDPAALAIAFDGATRTLLEPWYRAAVFQDGQDEAVRRAVASGDQGHADQLLSVRGALFALIRTDPGVWRAFVRTLNLLDPPEALLADPQVAAKLMEAMQDGQRAARLLDEAGLGPSREETLRILAAA